MKRLVITNGIPKYLDCSMFGSYYISCEIVEKTENWTTIRYFDDIAQEYDIVQIGSNDIEYIQKIYERDNKQEIYAFVKNIRSGEISLDEAVKIILAHGEIKP